MSMSMSMSMPMPMPMPMPQGTAIFRPFLPARDFGVSREFYESLGFEKLLDGEVAIFGAGATSFILQRYFQKEWAENFMMQLMVGDLDGWWAHVESLNLADRFGVPLPKAPEVQPWGLRVAYIVDPAGVLWHIAQQPNDPVIDRSIVARAP